MERLERRAWWSRHRSLLILLVVSFALRLVLVWAVRDFECQGDQCAFLHAARSVLRGEGFSYNTGDWDEGHTPPLYVLFLSACLAVGGDSLSSIRIAQALVSTAAAAVAFWLARRWSTERAALLAAGFVAFFPTFLGYFQWAFSETIFVLEVGLVALASVRLHERRKLADAVALGVLLGITCLTRSMMLYFAVPLAIWLFWMSPRPRRRTLALLGTMLGFQFLTIAPWTAYNFQRFDRFLLLSTNAGNVFHRNLNWTPLENYDYRAGRLTSWELDREPRRRCREENPVDRFRCEKRGGVAFVLENPGRTVHYAFLKLRALWNPSTFLVKYVAGGAYGDVSPGAQRFVALGTAVSVIVATLLGTIGLAGGPVGPVRSVMLLFFVYWHAVHGLALGMSRYRVPLMFFMLIAAAVALDRWGPSVRAAVTRPSSALAIPWIALLLLAWFLYFPVLLGIGAGG